MALCPVVLRGPHSARQSGLGLQLAKHVLQSSEPFPPPSFLFFNRTKETCQGYEHEFQWYFFFVAVNGLVLFGFSFLLAGGNGVVPTASARGITLCGTRDF